MKANRPGRPIEFNDEIAGRILYAIPHVLTISQIAGYSKVPKQSLQNWLKRGEEESKTDEASIFAQFWFNYQRARADVVKELIDVLKSRPKVYQPIIFLLERCFREDFGVDSHLIQELIDNIKKLSNPKIIGEKENAIS